MVKTTVPTVEGMVLANPCFISTVRTTICDIMCTTNTARMASNPRVSASTEPLLVALPYEKVKSFAGAFKATTRFQKLKGEAINGQKMNELRQDRETFYYRMLRERQDVNALKNRAATRIQAAFRGFRSRPRNHAYHPQRKRIPNYSQNDMQDELCTLASLLHLPPIPGLNLEARTKASKRKLRIENAGAFRIQRFFKMILCKKMALVVVRNKVFEKRNNSARTITKAVRFVITKKFVKRVDLIKRERSAIKIQAYVRRFLSTKRVHDLLKNNQSLWKQNEAVVIIQRNLAERHRGALRLARATMASLRSFRKLVDVVMNGIIAVYFDDVLSAYMQEYVEKLTGTRDEVSATVIEICVEEEIQDMFTIGLAQHIDEELRKIEEERRRVAEERNRLEECAFMSAEEDAQRKQAEAVKNLHGTRVEKEKKRAMLFKEAKDSVIRSTVDDLLNAVVDTEVQRRLVLREKELFARTVGNIVDRVTDGGMANACSLLVAQYLLDLANQTSMVIAEVSQRLTEDSISVGLSLFSDKLSFLAREVGAIADEEEGATITNADTQDDASTQIDNASLEDEVRSEVMEMDDEEEGGAVRAAVVVKEVRGTVQYLSQGRFEAALQDLEPALALVQTKINEATAENRPEAFMVRLGVVLSIMLLLKARCLFALARYAESKELLQEVHEIRAEAFDGKHYLVGEELCAMAEWHRAMADYATADRLLTAAEVILGDEMKVYEHSDGVRDAGDPEEAVVSNTVFKVHHRILLARADLMRNTGQYFKAHALLLRIEASLKRFKAKEVWSFEIEEDFLVSLMALFAVSGKQAIARTWHRDLLNKRQGRYRDRHPKIASSLCVLGKLALHMGDLAEGAQLIEDGLRMRYDFYPANHPAIAAGHLLKSQAFLCYGRCHDAFLEAVKALNIFQANFASSQSTHPSIARCFFAIGSVQQFLGEPLLAHNSLARAVEGYTVAFGLDLHQFVNEALFLQACTLISRACYLEAIDHLKSLIDQRERMLQVLRVDKGATGEPVDLLFARLCLGHCYIATTQWGVGMEILPAALQSLETALGSRHSMVAQGVAWMGQLNKLRGNFSDAKILLGNSYDLLSSLFPAGHPMILSVLVDSADNLRMPGFYDEALEMTAGGLSMATEVFAQSPSNVRTASLLICRAELLRDAGSFEEAEQLFLQAINVVRQKSGPLSGAYAVALMSLAELYHLQQRWALAERSYLQAFKILLTNFGPRSLTYQISLGQYATLLMDTHHWPEAFELLKGEVLPFLTSVLNAKHPLVMYTEANTNIAYFMVEGAGDISVGDHSLGALSETLLVLPKVQLLLASWYSAGFSLSHPWILRLQHLPQLLTASLSASVYDSSSASRTSYYSASQDQRTRRSALSVISEREESLSTSAQSLSHSLTDDGSVPSLSHETASQSSQSLGTYNRYDYDSASASYLSPRSLSYASYQSYGTSLTPRSAMDGSSLDESPRSVLTMQSSSVAHTSITPSSAIRSKLINIEESTVGSWEYAHSHSHTAEDDGSESQLNDSVLSDQESLSPR